MLIYCLLSHSLFTRDVQMLIDVLLPLDIKKKIEEKKPEGLTHYNMHVKYMLPQQRERVCVCVVYV